MKHITIDISNNSKAKEFSKKLTSHKIQKMKELLEEGLSFMEKLTKHRIHSK